MIENMMPADDSNKESPNMQTDQDRVYRLHQAFDNVYTHLKSDADQSGSIPQGPLQYHHCPEKLFRFSDNNSYFSWGVELYENGQALLHQLSDIVNINDRARSKSEIKALLAKLKILAMDLHDYRVDVAEYQCCILAKGIQQQYSYVEVLSDLIRYLDSLEYRIITTAHRKMSEINTGRMTIISLSLSLIAVLMTAVLVFFNLTH